MKKTTEKGETFYFSRITRELLRTVGVLTRHRIAFDHVPNSNRISIDEKTYPLDLIVPILAVPVSLADALPQYLEPDGGQREEITSPPVSKAKMQSSLLDIELLHTCFRSLPLRRRFVRKIKDFVMQNEVHIRRFFDRHPRVFAILNTRTVKTIYRRLTRN